MAAAAVVLALSVSGCGRGDEVEASTSVAGSSRPAAAAAPDPAHPPAGTAAGLVSRSAVTDLYEIEASRLALGRSQDNDVRRFAQKMVDEHTRTSNEARAMLAQQGVQASLPTGMDAERRARIRTLGSAARDRFDAVYIDQQIKAHEDALGLMRGYAETGDNKAFRDWASRTAAAVEDHLQMARALDHAPTGGTAGGVPTNENAGGSR
jgi:putative membrane protein